MITLELRPSAKRTSKYADFVDAYWNGALVCTSRCPLFDAARVLMDRGYGPDVLATVRWVGSPHDSFEALPLAKLSRLVVREGDKEGLRLRAWRPHARDSKPRPWAVRTMT